MEDEIQDKLENLYNLKFDVKFIEFRKYEIYVRIDYEHEFSFMYLYNAASTLDANVTWIRERIEREIINCYRKKV